MTTLPSPCTVDDMFTKDVGTVNGTRWQRFKVDPIELLADWKWPADNIIYDPKLKKGDFSIIRTHSHDGTRTFYKQQLAEIMLLLVNRRSCRAKDQPDMTRLRNVIYTIGPMKVSAVYGHVKVNAGTVWGLRERFRMPVKCEYIYGDVPNVSAP